MHHADGSDGRDEEFHTRDEVEYGQDELDGIERLISGDYSEFESSGSESVQDFTGVDVNTLVSHIEEEGVDWRAAVIELTDRALADGDPEVIQALCLLGKLAMLKNDRLSGYVSLSWYVVSVLVSLDLDTAIAAGSEICRSFDPAELASVTQWLKVDNISDFRTSAE
ncbi:hypothetical protein [Nocardia fluminea]|uniref:hypothetical protein n=1 Tax=Nocardia fluminea TaxID=134984 RepID=UPI003D0B5AB6